MQVSPITGTTCIHYWSITKPRLTRRPKLTMSTANQHQVQGSNVEGRRDIGNNQTQATSHDDKALDEEAMEDLISLLSVLKLISSQTGTGSARSKDALARGLDNYDRLSAKTNFSEHQPYFYEIYRTHRSSILKSDLSTQWLEDEAIVVWYGYHLPSVKARNIKISLSTFYNRALTIKDDLEARDELFQHESKLKGGNYTGPSPIEDESYYYADEMLYYLVCVFKHSIRGTRHQNDAVSLTKLITELGININLEQERTAPTNNSFDGLLRSIIGVASQCGLRAPDGSDPTEMLNSLNGEGIGAALNSLINNDKFKQTISQAVTTIGSNGPPTDTNSMVEVVTSLARDMTPIITEAVKVADTIPPPGVVDTRTPEQKAAAAQQMNETVSTVSNVLNQLTSGLNLNGSQGTEGTQTHSTTGETDTTSK